MKATNIKTEYLTNPSGIDVKNPRISWNCLGGKKQTSYEIEFAIDGEKRTHKNKSQSMHFDFFFPLQSRSHVDFRIRLYDENDEPGEWSEYNSFELGLLKENDWRAQWISGNYKANGKDRYPVDCFKKDFEISAVKAARLYISARGLYEARINGERCGDFIFAPGSFDYRKRVQYQTYDVTDLVVSGKNSLCVELADGWYRGSSGAKGRVNTYGKQTQFLAQLEITKNDGTKFMLATDNSWSWSNDGPIIFADLKDGEKVDARKCPSYDKKAKTIKKPAKLTSSNNFSVTENEKFKPIRLIITPKGKKVLEFEQNISGYISFSLMAHLGERIHITLGEMLDKDGELSLENIQCTFKGKKSPLQEIDYLCKEGRNDYKPKFFYGGFRYAQIDTDIPFEKDDFTAIAVYSGFSSVSEFECSNPLINKLYQSTMWSLKSNSTDIPSDCPTRERMGWTGDSEIFFPTASYMVDYAAFARKHVRDIFDRQWKSGRLPQIAPYAHEDWFMWTMNGSVGWACAGVYIPLNFYEVYGDDRLLQEHFEGIMNYAGFMIKRAGKWGGIYAKPVHISFKNRKYFVNCGQSYGEWAEPNDVMAFKWYDFASPHPEESTAYTYFTLHRVLKASEILHKENDQRLKKVKEYSEGAKKAYQEYVSKPKYSLDTDRQAKLVRPLYMGLLDEQQTEFAKKRLIKALDHYNWRVGTGFLSTPMILYVLEDIDIDYAYKLLENEEKPGWLYMMKNGATTIWEAWEGNSTSDKGIGSLNHYSKGAVCEWLFKEMCGVKIAGENNFVIAPRPGGNITYARFEYLSQYGLVKSAWQKEEKKTIYEISIPSNTQAKIVLPGIAKTLDEGDYVFEIEESGASENE